MSKIVGPLFSLEAKGNFNKVIGFFSKAGATYAGFFRPLSERNTQIVGRVTQTMSILFNSGMEAWYLLAPFTKAIWVDVAKGKPLLGRCSFMSTYLKEKGVYWASFPFPLSTVLYYYSDQIADYDKKVSDMELLTDLDFSSRPEAFYTEYSIPESIGQANMYGGWYVLPSSLFDYYPPDVQSFTIYHEMTHCLMAQHGWFYIRFTSKMAEEICDEVAQRMVDGVLTPVYRYSKNNKTLHEIIYGF